jgi:hypothetical protein
VTKKLSLNKRKIGKYITMFLAIFLAVSMIIPFIFIDYSVEIKKLFTRYAMPSRQSGTQVFKGDMVARYATIGYTLMVDSHITSVSLNDVAVIFAVEESSPRLSGSGYDRKSIYKSGGSTYMEASIRVRNSAGSYVWWNYKLLLCPSGFNYNSPVLGRSLLDNLFSESGVNKKSLADKISKQGVTGWINSIVSVFAIKNAIIMPPTKKMVIIRTVTINVFL